MWHKVSEKNCEKLRKIFLKDTKTFYQLLFKFGYKFTNNSKEKIKILKNFQRRFRPQLITTAVDKECFAIIKSLI